MSERERKNGERQSTVQVPGVFLACPEARNHNGFSGLELQLKWEPNVCVRLSSVWVHCLFSEAAGMSPPTARLFCGRLENPHGLLSLHDWAHCVVLRGYFCTLFGRRVLWQQISSLWHGALKVFVGVCCGSICLNRKYNHLLGCSTSIGSAQFTPFAQTKVAPFHKISCLGC